jgi:hypothetical protein
MKHANRLRISSAVCGVGLGLASIAIGAVGASADDVAPVPETRPGVLASYLPATALPDSVALLPQPPVEGSIGQAMDDEASRTDLALQGTARWKLAAMDANLSFPWAAGDFACSLGGRDPDRNAASLSVAAPLDGGCGVFDPRGEGSLPTQATVHDQFGPDLHPRRGRWFGARWRLSLRTHCNRLDLGADP